MTRNKGQGREPERQALCSYATYQALANDKRRPVLEQHPTPPLFEQQKQQQQQQPVPSASQNREVLEASDLLAIRGGTHLKAGKIPGGQEEEPELS